LALSTFSKNGGEKKLYGDQQFGCTVEWSGFKGQREKGRKS